MLAWRQRLFYTFGTPLPKESVIKMTDTEQPDDLDTYESDTAHPLDGTAIVEPPSRTDMVWPEGVKAKYKW